jgi:hypothetical protein
MFRRSLRQRASQASAGVPTRHGVLDLPSTPCRVHTHVNAMKIVPLPNCVPKCVKHAPQTRTTKQTAFFMNGEDYPGAVRLLVVLSSKCNRQPC